jgi:O-antigen ligase
MREALSVPASELVPRPAVISRRPALYASSRSVGGIPVGIGASATLVLALACVVAVLGVSWLPLAVAAAAISFVGLVAVGEFWGLVGWFALSPWLQPFYDDYLRIGTPVSFDRLFFPAVFAAFLIRRLVTRRKLTIDWVTGSMAVFATYYAVTLLYANDPYKDGVALVQHYILSFATYVVVAATVTTSARLWTLLTVNAVNIALLDLVGVQEHFTGTSIFTGDLAFTGIYQGRSAGPFVNPAVYGVVLVMMAFLAIGFARRARNPRDVVWVGLLSALTICALYFTYTRSVWVSLAVGVVVFAIADRRLRRPIFTASIALGIAIAFLYPALEADPDLYNRITDPSNGIGRLDNAELQWQAFANSPLIGDGPGVFNAYHNIREGWVSHNAFLTIIVDNGILGLLAFVAALTAATIRMVRALIDSAPNTFERDTIVACLAGLAAYLTTTMFIDDIYFVFPTAFFWLVLALPVAIGKRGGLT